MPTLAASGWPIGTNTGSRLPSEKPVTVVELAVAEDEQLGRHGLGHAGRR